MAPQPVMLLRLPQPGCLVSISSSYKCLHIWVMVGTGDRSKPRLSCDHDMLTHFSPPNILLGGWGGGGVENGTSSCWYFVSHSTPFWKKTTKGTNFFNASLEKRLNVRVLKVIWLDWKWWGDMFEWMKNADKELCVIWTARHLQRVINVLPESGPNFALLMGWGTWGSTAITI